MLKNGPHAATSQRCLQRVREHLRRGGDIVIYDFDGPRAPDGTPLCEMVSAQLLEDKINDPTFPGMVTSSRRRSSASRRQRTPREAKKFRGPMQESPIPPLAFLRRAA
jgi:hypothetical protein